MLKLLFRLSPTDYGLVAKQLGLIHPTTGTRTVRSVYIVDPEGTIQIVLTYPETVGRNIHEIIRAVQALQVTYANRVATPANWPNNELIGSKVIVPPARTVQEAAKRKSEAKAGQLDCFDWWFCTK